MMSLLIGLGLAYAGLVGALYLTQRSFLYLPDTAHPEPERFGVPQMSPVTIRTADGLDLSAWWRPPATPRSPTMLYLHGNGGHIGHRGEKVRFYLDRGWGVLLLSWRGYGGNPGSPSEAGLFADAEAALAHTRREAPPGAPLVIYGESLGSGPAVMLASRHDIAALILEAPFTSITDLAARRFPYVPVRFLLKDRFASIERIAKVRAPVMIVHGEDDATVPVAHGRRLLDEVRSDKSGLFVTGGGHNDLRQFGVDRAIAAFILSNIDEK